MNQLDNKIKKLKILDKFTKFIFFDKIFRQKLKDKIHKKIINLINKEYANKYPEDYIIFSRNGVGDIYFVASLLEEFKKRHSGRIVFLTDKPHLKDYLQSFNCIDEIIANKNLNILQNTEQVQRELQKGQINYIYFPYRGKKKNYVFADSYANLLDLPLSARRKAPYISINNERNAQNEIAKLDINAQKSIILIPEAVMFDYRVLPPKFWKKLANRLINEGYNVIINSNNKAYKNYKTTFLPIIDFLALCKKVNHIVSFRSGICDVLAGINIKNITAIYPHNLEVIWANKFIFDNLLNQYHEKCFDSEFANIFNIYSLNSNFGRNDIQEITYDFNDEVLINKIILNIKYKDLNEIDNIDKFTYN